MVNRVCRQVHLESKGLFIRDAIITCRPIHLRRMGRWAGEATQAKGQMGSTPRNHYTCTRGENMALKRL